MGRSLDGDEVFRFGKTDPGGKTYHTVRMPLPSEIQDYEREKGKVTNKRGKVEVESNETKALYNMYRKIIVKVEGFGDADILGGSPDIERVIKKIPLVCLEVTRAVCEVTDTDTEDLRQD